MKSRELPGSSWVFSSVTVDHRVRWSWKRFEPDNVVREASEAFHKLSDAMADARKHGFSERTDKFSIY